MFQGQLEEEKSAEEGIDKEEQERAGGSRISEIPLPTTPDLRPKTPLEENTVLAALLNEDREPSPVGVEEVWRTLWIHPCFMSVF